MAPEGNWASNVNLYELNNLCNSSSDLEFNIDVAICSCIYIDSTLICNYYLVSSSSCIFLIRSRVSCGNTPMIFFMSKWCPSGRVLICSHFHLLFDKDLDLSKFYLQIGSEMYLFSRMSIMATTIQCISTILLPMNSLRSLVRSPFPSLFRHRMATPGILAYI